jgi:ABC-type multidrug transport system ATPase subunit
MAQRLGLAVAMVPAAPVLLLDEPTASLDPDGLRAFRDFVDARRASGGTVLFSSHQVADAERLADRFVILVAGRVAASITRTQLRELDVPIGRRSIDAGRLDALYRSLVGGALE